MAFIIANQNYIGKYEKKPLQNCFKDAEDIKTYLLSIKFKSENIHIHKNMKKSQMEDLEEQMKEITYKYNKRSEKTILIMFVFYAGIKF